MISKPAKIICQYESCQEEATTTVDPFSAIPVCEKHKRLAQCKILIMYNISKDAIINRYGYKDEYIELMELSCQREKVLIREGLL